MHRCVYMRVCLFSMFRSESTDDYHEAYYERHVISGYHIYLICNSLAPVI